MKKSTREEFEAFVLSQVIEDGDRAKPMTIKDADNYLSVVVDLLWPDIPVGFTVEEFAESYNRHLAQRKASSD